MANDMMNRRNDMMFQETSLMTVKLKTSCNQMLLKLIKIM